MVGFITRITRVTCIAPIPLRINMFWRKGPVAHNDWTCIARITIRPRITGGKGVSFITCITFITKIKNISLRVKNIVGLRVIYALWDLTFTTYILRSDCYACHACYVRMLCASFLKGEFLKNSPFGSHCFKDQFSLFTFHIKYGKLTGTKWTVFQTLLLCGSWKLEGVFWNILGV